MNISKKIASITIAAVTSILAFSSQAVELKAGDDSIYTDLCITAASGNRAVLHNAIKATGMSKKFISTKVQCNSKDMISFVSQYGENKEDMIRALNHYGTKVSIRDLAMLGKKYR
ncbi:DUF3718 domain-containing protein [Thalassotalea ganghwensis]